jgi:hypothetical protein
MIPCNRRDFLKHTLAGAGLALTAPAWRGLAAEPAAPLACKGDDLVPLGRTGIKVSRLAQGTGYNGWARQSDHTRLGQAGFDRLAHHSLDRGIRFFDMADLYGTHPFVRDVIKGLPRDRVVLLSKIWVRKEDWVTPSGGAVAEVDRFCQELGTDHLDVCLMHCMTDDKWVNQFEHVRDELTTLKQKGRVRAVGVSCHDLGALQLAATHPWVDVIFARINYKGGKDYSMDGTAGPQKRQGGRGHEDFWRRQADRAGAEGHLAQVRLRSWPGGRDHHRHEKTGGSGRHAYPDEPGEGVRGR